MNKSAFVGGALTEPSRDDRHFLELAALDRFLFVSFIVGCNELRRLACGILTVETARHRKPS